MNGFFKLDGKFYKYGTILADIIVLTLLWTITSLPIITIGASTTAMYYVTTRAISNREGYVSKDFFRSFKENFLQATGASFILMAAFAFVIINIHTLPGSSLMFPIQFVLLAVLVAETAFIFPVLSRFKLRFFELFRTSFFLAVRHFPTTFTCIVLLYAIYMLVIRMPIAFVVCAGAYAFLTSLMFMRIFRKYLPDMDTDKYDEMKMNGELDTANQEIKEEKESTEQ